ncbi:ATP/GTP-binding protein [Catellatospora sp. TT07R-123]|uniref:GTP-binding protein n=1 Tax=Catellatospora sp. TT07R-123 TaxID=2733863 RepID=UPI001BB40E39|nr:ATP/GTP-binding protein [Catellatospora sp. TT07R-123]
MKLAIVGGFGSGKTTAIDAVSEVTPLRTEEVITRHGIGTDDTTGVPYKTTSTVVMDFGRVTLAPRVVLYLFGTPGTNRFWYLWDGLLTGSSGALVLADTRRLADSFAAIDYLEQSGTPFVLGVNCFDGARAYSAADLREALDVDAEVPIVLMDARDRSSVKEALTTLVRQILGKAESRHPGGIRS